MLTRTLEQIEAENRELRAYLKAFCAATIEPEDLGKDVQAHQTNPFIEYQFLYVEEGDPKADRTITGGQVRRAMELVGFDKLKIEAPDRTISEELTEARDLRHEVEELKRRLDRVATHITIEGIEKLFRDLARTAEVDPADQILFDEAADRLREYDREAREAVAATNGRWMAWSELDCDGDHRVDPNVTYSTDWYVGYWRDGESKADIAVYTGSRVGAATQAKSLAAHINRMIRLTPTERPGQPEVPERDPAS